jgi:hypothetical protein
MQGLKWLIVLIVGLLLLSWQPNVAHSQASSTATNYIVVTLDQLTVTGPQTLAIQPIRLMLGAVSASGSRVQKILWPAQIWANGSIGTPFMPDDRSAIPLFALPEDQMGDELGFGVIALNNTISPDQHPEDWLNNAMPTVIEAASDPVALWVTGQPTSTDDEAGRISQAIAPLLGGNAQIGVIAVKFAKSNDWGVSAQTYGMNAGNLNVKYRIRRVSVPADGNVEVHLKGIAVQKTGRSGSDPAQLFIWARGSSSFSGESFNGLVRRLPFADFYALKTGQSQALDEVLYSGELGAFLYTELSVWDEQANGPVSMGALSDLWTAEELSATSPGSFSVTLKGANGSQVTLDLAIQLSGLTSPAVLTVDHQSLQFTGQVGQPSPTSQTLRITNTSGGTLNWTATTDSPWLSVSPTSGTAPSTVTVSANIVNLSAGSLQGRITISAPGAQNSPAIVTVTLTLSAGPNQPPIASFTISPSNPKVGDTVTFDASTSRDPDGSIISYAWDFGDGFNGSGRIATHVYHSTGSYTVSLRITDERGTSALTTQTFAVQEIVVRTLSGHTDEVTSVAFSPNGTLLASGSRKTIKLWDLATGREVRTLNGHTDWVDSVAFSPDGKLLASGSNDDTINSGK